MSTSYCNLHPASHTMLVDISDVWVMPGTICACFAFSSMPAVSRLHVCVDLSFDLSWILVEIGCYLVVHSLLDFLVGRHI